MQGDIYAQRVEIRSSQVQIYRSRGQQNGYHVRDKNSVTSSSNFKHPRTAKKLWVSWPTGNSSILESETLKVLHVNKEEMIVFGVNVR